MSKIEINAEPATVIEVHLVGKDYEVTPPKAALAMRMAVEAKQTDNDPEAVQAMIDRWLEAAVGKKVATAIRKRLDDPKDVLDLPHVTALMQQVIEVQTGDPTT